ncbi:HprK-related kinase A [Inmirania thermothiophila]|uniref:Hpr(Ser) kinase/phosphatase n=1 Tax=Inmirania thermothiophila TaxID=1750597 RepID=A0A3N1XSM0_9GAMM|nr:HprK-related kinase A [Inmirania thermothiophila]ROR29646.1 Hpr(Ser) kinase/phosphatase [Inmirania thermothiophila]
MRVADCPPRALARRLARGLVLEVGPLAFRLRTPFPEIAAHLHRLYPDHRLSGPDAFADWSVELLPGRGLRRRLRPQARLVVDGHEPFRPLPRGQACPLLEWGLNWCVYSQAHWWIVVHAAVVADGDRALLLAGDSGAGKSTLCAALLTRGWRLLSDELALLDPRDGRIQPLPRPVSLKDRAIELVAGLAPGAVLSDPVATDGKGWVAHLRPPPGSVARAREPARAAWLILPEVTPGSPPAVGGVGPGRALMALVRQCVNYTAVGPDAFERLADIAASVPAYRLRFDDLAQAAALVDGLTRHARDRAAAGA